MTHDEDIEMEPPAQPRARSGGRLVIAGIVGACALGAGLGLWARPAAHERQFAVAPKEEAKPETLPTRMLEIVIDDTPAPIGALMDVMPAGVGSEFTPPASPIPVQPLAPRPSPTGLMRVDTQVVTVEPPPVVKPVLQVVEAQPEPPKPVVVVAKPKPKPQAPSKAQAKPKPDTKVAVRKAPKAEPKKLAKAEPKPKKVEKAKLAKAETKPRKAEKAEGAKPSRLVRLARAVKAAPAKVEKKIERKIAKAEKPKESRKAKLARIKAEKRQVEMAKAQARKLQLIKAEARKPKKKIEARGTGPMRVARANPCALSDPGEAVVCADPRLASRDRQMQVAYRNAESAGVPASALRRQQQRWVAARAAAAREAPWAVEDVYQARIAELNDLAREGDGSY